MPFYQVGQAPIDAVILGRCYVYPPGTVLWFEHLPAALTGLVAPLETPPGTPPRVQRDGHATPPVPNMETKA